MGEIEKAIKQCEIASSNCKPMSLRARGMATAIYALRSQLTREQNEPCEWRQEDEDSSDYSSSCGSEFVFNEDGPDSNDFIYCPKCGKPIKEIQWELDE